MNCVISPGSHLRPSPDRRSSSRRSAGRFRRRPKRSAGSELFGDLERAELSRRLHRRRTQGRSRRRERRLCVHRQGQSRRAACASHARRLRTALRDRAIAHDACQRADSHHARKRGARFRRGRCVRRVARRQCGRDHSGCIGQHVAAARFAAAHRHREADAHEAHLRDASRGNAVRACACLAGEVDSCQTDLEIPLAPLDAAAVGRESCAARGEEQRKDTDRRIARERRGRPEIRFWRTSGRCCSPTEKRPAAAIPQRRSRNCARLNVKTRVSIVGFAIDDARLAAAFRHWSNLGAGLYFDAKDAARPQRGDVAMRCGRRSRVRERAGSDRRRRARWRGSGPFDARRVYGAPQRVRTYRSPSVTVKAKETTTVQL